MDISSALIAKSDQLNAIDLIGEPRTVTVVDVVQGNAEQPVNIITDVFGKGRPFKPSKTVLRILAGAWGKDTTAWIGHSMTVYREPSVRWAGEEIGGIRIKALSHIDKPIVFNLPTSKGKFAKSTVQPLAVAPAQSPRDWAAELVLAADDLEAVAALGAAATKAHAPAEDVAAIRAEWKRLSDAGKADAVVQGEVVEEGSA